MKPLLLLGLLTTLASGCANPYARFYSARNIAPPLPKGDYPVVYQQTNLRDKVGALRQQGFSVLGVSSFMGSVHNPESMMIAQAKKVGAETVLYNINYSHAEQGIAPVVQFNPGQTIVSQQNGYVSSGGVSGYYNGQSVTRLPDSYSTTYIPYTRQVFRYEAVFLRQLPQK